MKILPNRILQLSGCADCDPCSGEVPPGSFTCTAFASAVEFGSPDVVTDFSLIPVNGYCWRAQVISTVPISCTANIFQGRWQNFCIAGDSTIVAYADNADGDGFSLTDGSKCWIAYKSFPPDTTPVQADYEGLWYDRCSCCEMVVNDLIDNSSVKKTVSSSFMILNTGTVAAGTLEDKAFVYAEGLFSIDNALTGSPEGEVDIRINGDIGGIGWTLYSEVNGIFLQYKIYRLSATTVQVFIEAEFMILIGSNYFGTTKQIVTSPVITVADLDLNSMTVDFIAKSITGGTDYVRNPYFMVETHKK